MRKLSAVLLLLAWAGAWGMAGCSAPTESEAREAAAPAPVAAPAPAAPEAATPAPAATTPKVTIYRDTWGIPHVYADTVPAAMYGLGYAQAEDRLEDLLRHVRIATGTMAEAFGPEYLEADRIMHMMKNPEMMEKYWQTEAPAHVRDMGDYFMRGVQAYIDEHPEKKPEWAPELHGWQCGAVMRALILDWPVGTVMDDFNNRHQDPGKGSNEWAVMPSRSAEGVPILLTDPHLTWEGMAVFHEARVHAGDVHVNGFYVVGTPMPGIGHTDYVGWACTTGGPDTSDVYEVKLNPDNPMQYRYDGEWKDFTVEQLTIPVKGQDPAQVTFLYTVHGPLLAEPDKEKGVAYAAATPYIDQPYLLEQMYKMGTAKNTDEFRAALGMNQFMEQNLLFADRDGNVQYVRTGRVPIRPEGDYNWDAPVDGSTSATRWLGIHAVDDLVQVKNPEQGYLQNCNISPGKMTENSPMTPDKYKEYLYNTSWDSTNPRGERALQMLAADDSITEEEAMAIAMDVYDLLAEPWKNALKAAVDRAGADKMKDADFASTVNDILGWDGNFSVESTAAPVVKFWRLKCEQAIDPAVVAEGRELSEADQAKILDLLSETIAEMKTTYGRLGVTWGDVNVIGRDGRYFPAGGMNFGDQRRGNKSISLRVVGGARELPDQKGKFLGRSGSMTLMLMFFHKDGIESHSCHVYGVSGDPQSPHYVDQAEKLYSQRKFKPTFWKKEDLLKNVESEKTLGPGV